MGQSASRRHRPVEPPPPQEDQPSRPARPRTLRNSLLSFVSSSASDGTSSRRASRRWSRAPQPKPDPVVPIVSQEPQEEDAVPPEDGHEEEHVQVEEPTEPDLPPERPRTPVTTTVTPPPDPPPIRGPPAGTLVLVQGIVHTTDTRPPDPTQATPAAAMSSSSIDVLGTLLTVAAQATAASLLSGSGSPSNPALPAGSPNGTTQLPRRNPWSALRERLGPGTLPALPAPTPALPLPAPANPDAPPLDERSSMLAEMARAFNVGLGLSPPSPSSSNTPNSTATPAPEVATPVQIPEQGTFERFLVDLQADLRVTLGPRRSLDGAPSEREPSGETHPSLDSTAAMVNPTPEQEETTSVSPYDATPILSQSEGPVVTPSTPITTSSASEPLPTDAPSVPSDAAPESPPSRGQSAVNWWRLYQFPAITVTRSAETGPTPIPSDSPGAGEPNSVSSSQYAHSAGPEAEEPVHPSLPDSSTTEMPSPVTATPTQPTRAATMPPRTVVPVIVVGLQSVPANVAVFPGPPPPHMGPEAAGQGHDIRGVIPMSAASSTTGGIAHVPTQAEEIVPPSSAELPTDLSPQITESEAGELARSTSGLAGRTMEGTRRRRSWWRPRMRPLSSPAAVSGLQAAPTVETPTPASGIEDGSDVIVEDLVAAYERRRGLPVSSEAENPDDEAAVASRRHSTPIAASEAIASPIDTPAHPPPPAGNPTSPESSRTFLIYVIGGYYPPEHGILTSGGTPEAFEALLEVNDILGHIRPPTASKAEIARAGLAVVKRDELAGMSVTASCTEKCLICLDDYTKTDPIRVLGCRHAFHQGCVDTWLETGRNNCPACRTRGVPTDGRAGLAVPITSTQPQPQT